MTLSVEHLAYTYPGTARRVFSDVSFALEQGDIVSVLGPNGAGKSTLLNCVLGLLEPDEGEILLQAQSLRKMPVREVARHIAFVPQTHVPVYDYTVLDFVVLGRAPYMKVYASPSEEDYRKAEKALARLNAAYLADKIYTRISGGERQLVMIARAIAQEPDFIFLDEPTAHLDYGNQIKTVRMIRQLAREGFGIVMTTHNPDQVLYTGGKVALLSREGSLRFGEAEEIISARLLSELYQEDVVIQPVEALGRRVCLTGKREGNDETAF